MTDPGLSPVTEFTEVFAQREDLIKRSQGASILIKDLLKSGIDTADSRLVELARDPDVHAYFASVSGPAMKAAIELEEVRPTLLALGLEDEIEAKRREIESMLSGDEMKAARHFLNLSGVSVESTVSPTSPARAEAEGQKPHLTILIDPNNNISVNGEVYALSRKIQQARKDKQEAAGRKLRTDTIRFLSQNPDRDYLSRELWENIRPDEDFNFGLWNRYCGSVFFNEELMHDQQAIVIVNTKHPKRHRYGLNESFSITVEDTEEIFEVWDETVFTLPDGREVAGKTGKVLNMLIRATAEKPLTEAILSGLYTIGELQRAKNIRNLFTGIVNSARSELSDTNLRIIKVLTDEIDPDSHRRRPGYYMIEKVPPGQALTLHEATVLAAFLDIHSERLAKKGLAILPKGVFDSLNQRVVETYTNGGKSDDELKELRLRAFEKAIALMGDSEALEEVAKHFEKEAKDDPRLDLLVHLLEYNEKDIEYITELLGAYTSVQLTFDAGRRKGYALVDRKVTRHGRGGRHL